MVSFDSFGQYIVDCDEDAADFLPSPSFDELQSSIFSSSNELHMTLAEDQIVTAQKKPTTQKQISKTAPKMTSDIKASISARSLPDSSLGKGSANSRHQGPPNRQSNVSSTASKVIDPFNTLGTTRARRQSLHPYSAGAAIVSAAKASRKSFVPNIPDAESSKLSFSNRRPSSASAPQSLEEKEGISNKTRSDNLKGLTVAPTAKINSLQASAKNVQSPQAVDNFEQQKTMNLANKSQSRATEKEKTQSSARKRMSVIPGMPSQSHPTGLGARTVSPTDARRAKRLSVLQSASLGPSTPPTPQSDTTLNGISSRSSSILFPKVSTPTSSHASPDPNRKSYITRHSPSHASGPNYNKIHDTSGSISHRLPLSTSSRTLCIKPRSLHSLVGNEEEDIEDECIPPVPAIPKAFESPRESLTDSTSFSARKSSLPLEPNSSADMSSEIFSDSSLLQEKSKNFIDLKLHSIDLSDFKIENDHNRKKKPLQPLRLPPFNLRPLSTATANKVEAQEDVKKTGNDLVNTPHQTSPISSPKSTSSGNKNDSSKSIRRSSHSRSSSAIHFLRSTPQLNLSFSKSGAKNSETRLSGYQPVTSLTNKNNIDYGCLPRSKMSHDSPNTDYMVEQQRPPRIPGSSATNPNNRSSIRETPPVPQSGLEESSTSIPTSSLRRKLSLGWKRSASKGSSDLSHVVLERELVNSLPVKKLEHASPSRVPTSATIIKNNGGALPSPSLSIKSTTYIDFKRRKSSASSLSMFSNYHDRTISESWGVQHGSNNTSNPNSDRAIPTSRTSSMMHRMFNTRDSSLSIQLVDQWTVDLDRDDLTAEEEMRKLASKRKDTEAAARYLEALRKRATPKERMSPQEAIRNSNLNIFERGEVVDYKDVYFCGTTDAIKHVGELSSENVNFGYDDERGDYCIVAGDHLSYRYEIIDLLGKGSFGQVLRCVDHKTGGLAAVKIIRNKKRFHQQALVEVNILQKLRDWVIYSGLICRLWIEILTIH